MVIVMNVNMLMLVIVKCEYVMGRNVKFSIVVVVRFLVMFYRCCLMV